MATMVKEKRKEKKKTKEKSSRSSMAQELAPIQPSITTDTQNEAISTAVSESAEITENLESTEYHTESIKQESEQQSSSNKLNNLAINQSESQIESKIKPAIENITHSTPKSKPQSIETKDYSKEVSTSDIEGSYRELSNKLDRMAIPNTPANISLEREFELISPNAYLKSEEFEQVSPVFVNTREFGEVSPTSPMEEVMPSAPCFEEVPEMVQYEEEIVESKPKIERMAIEDVLRLFSGGEMEDVRALSEREEELVEAGPVSGPEHPLVDLLSTFRSSLMAVERERLSLTNGFIDEENKRKSLWKIDKRTASASQLCGCGKYVTVQVNYDDAQLAKDKIPVARMRLEGLLRDVQDSYCHHQHAALLAYYQIEELISETIRSNKAVIREALSLVLAALRLSADSLEALAEAMQRWATALAAALVDHRDLRQLLFIIHHLFRQSRSVSWAARVIQVRVDIESPARVLAIMELLLARPRIDAAHECTEDVEEVWEEIDKHGEGAAVSEGALRERDLLSLLHALPIRDLVARIMLFTHNDIKQARPHEWGDNSGGRGVLRACYGVRVLLHVLRSATMLHAGYGKLKQALRDIATNALHTLGCLHVCSSNNYAPEYKDKVTSELEAVFFEGYQLFDGRDICRLPATLLADDTVRRYCLTYIEQLHDTSSLSCNERVCIVCEAAIDRTQDYELARTIMEFLLQIALRRKSAQCKGTCESSARECVPRLLSAHPYLHTIALHILADMNMVEQLDPSCIQTLHVHKWRPTAGEVRALLDDWTRLCAHLLSHLLMQLDFTPHSGLPLDVQLTIGNWLCTYVRNAFPTSVPECWWTVLRRLRTHRSAWMLPSDAPPPDEDPQDLFSKAYALLSSSWGHCIPLICSEGVSALCSVSSQRPRDAVHCLSGVMLVMSHSPESLALTPKFNEIFTTLLSSGPSLMARALGRAQPTGAELLLRLMFQQMGCQHVGRGSILSAWLHALWRGESPAAALGALDSLAAATRLWPQLDTYASLLLQEPNSKEHVNHAVRNAASAPLLCECILRVTQGEHETLVHYGYARLLDALHNQRHAGHKIHVDNALQQVAANISSEELVIYRAANAALVAPLSHPSHLTLWRLTLHLYLQRAPHFPLDPPIGPLFFSGLLKSRTLNQMKKRLQETITYHHNEAETLKSSKSVESPTQQPASRPASSPISDDLLPMLTISDLTGDSSESDTEESLEESENRERSKIESDGKKKVPNLIAYHKAAEKMIGEYLCWLEEGERVQAMPHHADIARFIPEHALEAAWRQCIQRPTSQDDEFPLPTARPPPDNTPPNDPFHLAVARILNIKDRSRKRYKSKQIKSPVEDVDVSDARTLLALVEKHLKDIERLAHDWCDEVYRITALDTKLWELVPTLRVSRPIQPIKKKCPNKCTTHTISVQRNEWCISLDAERAVKENRNSARSWLRRLARARPHAANTAAALHSIVRRTRSSEAAVRIVERAWRCAGDMRCADCAPAKTVISTLVNDLCERWLCDNGRTCSQLLTSWGRRGTSSLQQALCGALVTPRRLNTTDWPALYTALLDSQLPSHALFSYLSKFEMPRWSSSADLTQRRSILDALLRSIQRFGPSPSSEHHMLIEILGVHTTAVMTSQDIPTHVNNCAQVMLQNKLPYTHWSHVVNAVDVKGEGVAFDQLGHLLRELGVMWWEARTGLKGPNVHVAGYAPYVARLLHALQRAFVAAAKKLSYEPKAVAWYSWSSLQESWGAWVTPHSGSLPLLPSTVDDEQYTCMLRHFVDTVHQIMLDCPGTEVYLLQQIFEWCIQAYVSVQTVTVTSPSVTSSQCTQESRVQASALLAELAKLPWSEHQWFFGKSLEVALQTSTSTDRELTSWCCTTWDSTRADTMLRDARDSEQLLPRLASLLYLLTGTTLSISQQIFDDACTLPWYCLPERAVDEAVERFYMVHHNVAQAYHDLPQFQLILLACELSVPPGEFSLQLSDLARSKRSLGISQWVRAATSPALGPHVPAHTTRLLNLVTQLGAHLSDSENDLEGLLCRAIVIMCIEPAASAALPVWLSWVSTSTPRLVLACASAVTSLTVFEHFATISDVIVSTAVNRHSGSISWSDIIPRWSQCPWRSASVLCARARLYAAYVCVSAHEHAPHDVLAYLQALLTADIRFVENEAIVAVWICHISRVASLSVSVEVTASARGVLSRWAEMERRSLISRVISTNSDKPTPLHLILCRYAQWCFSPDDNTRRGFESAFTSALGPHELAAWTVTPQLDKMVPLAKRLFPKNTNYFQYELSRE